MARSAQYKDWLPVTVVHLNICVQEVANKLPEGGFLLCVVRIALPIRLDDTLTIYGVVVATSAE